MKKQPAAVFILDLDGTLYPYNQAYYDACKNAVENAKLPLLTKFFNLIDNNQQHQETLNHARIHGLHERRRIYSRHEVSTVDIARKALNPSFIKFNDSLVSALEYAKDARIDLYVMTHSEKKWTDQVLNLRGLDHLFPPDKRITSEDLTAGKTSPDTFKTFLEQRLISPETDVIFFDDDIKYQEPAEENGIKFFQVTPETGVLPKSINIIVDAIKEKAQLTHAAQQPTPEP